MRSRASNGSSACAHPEPPTPTNSPLNSICCTIPTPTTPPGRRVSAQLAAQGRRCFPSRRQPRRGAASKVEGRPRALPSWSHRLPATGAHRLRRAEERAAITPRERGFGGRPRARPAACCFSTTPFPLHWRSPPTLTARTIWAPAPRRPWQLLVRCSGAPGATYVASTRSCQPFSANCFGYLGDQVPAPTAPAAWCPSRLCPHAPDA
jgi:hypothetical protein